MTTYFCKFCKKQTEHERKSYYKNSTGMVDWFNTHYNCKECGKTNKTEENGRHRHRLYYS